MLIYDYIMCIERQNIAHVRKAVNEYIKHATWSAYIHSIYYTKMRNMTVDCIFKLYHRLYYSFVWVVRFWNPRKLYIAFFFFNYFIDSYVYTYIAKCENDIMSLSFKTLERKCSMGVLKRFIHVPCPNRFNTTNDNA